MRWPTTSGVPTSPCRWKGCAHWPMASITRIGLSATQKPIEEIARLLVGASNISEEGEPDCTIVDTGHSRQMDIDLALPKEMELGPIATHELWADTLDDIAGLVSEHGTTLVFVNTRRLVERVAHQLSLRLGEDAVAAHHGSLSRATRLEAEEKLKSGGIKVCVATASLELGIDVGCSRPGVPDRLSAVDWASSPKVGRSGHTVGGTPKGRLFPLTRDELIECAALMKAISDRNLDALSIPPGRWMSWPSRWSPLVPWKSGKRTACTKCSRGPIHTKTFPGKGSTAW